MGPPPDARPTTVVRKAGDLRKALAGSSHQPTSSGSHFARYSACMQRVLKTLLKDGRFGDVSQRTARVMRSVGRKGNRSTELRLRMLLVREGLRGWTMHPTLLPARPDFAFVAQRVAIFCDGCFWHGCPQCCAHEIKTNREFWKKKIELNRLRDKRDSSRLKRNGWTVLRFWEHEIADQSGLIVQKIRKSCHRQRQDQ